MPEIVISEFMDEAALAGLRERHAVLYDPSLVDRPDDLLSAIAEARALVVRNRTQVRGDLLAAAGHLECIGRLGVGLDNIDTSACADRGIAVYPATGANDLSVAEYVITATLVLLRGAWQSTGDVIDGKWPRQALIGREVAGKTMGLVGFGAIARQVAARARFMGMDVIAHDPFLPEDHDAWRLAAARGFDELLAQADVVSLHTPLTDETHHLLGAQAIPRMKPGAILVNAARGGVVDEAALVAALRQGHLGGAALDVFEAEPLTGEAAERFRGLGNLVLTPHIAGVTDESNVRVSALIAEKIRIHLEKGPAT